MRFPKIKIRLDTIDWIIEAVAGMAIVTLLVLVIINYPKLPDIIPRHFNSSGEVDGMGGKSNLLLLPSIGIITYVLFTIVPKFPQLINNYPFEFTDESAEKHFRNALLLMRILKCLIGMGALYLTYATIQIAIGKMDDLGIWFLPIAISSILITTMGFLYRGYKIGQTKN